MIENYLIIEQNIVTNVCVWDGDTDTWTPPEGSVWVPQATTNTKVWVFKEIDYVLEDSIGNASIGFIWDGNYCVTNEDKPKLLQTEILPNQLAGPRADQPATSGTQTL